MDITKIIIKQEHINIAKEILPEEKVRILKYPNCEELHIKTANFDACYDLYNSIEKAVNKKPVRLVFYNEETDQHYTLINPVRVSFKNGSSNIFKDSGSVRRYDPFDLVNYQQIETPIITVMSKKSSIKKN